MSRQGHFQRFHRLVRGSMWDLPLQELRVLLAMEYFADNESGDTFATSATIHQLSGNRANIRHIERAISSLAKKGLLPVVKPGGGRGKAAVRRITLPKVETPAQDAGDCDTETPAHSAGESSHVNPGIIGQETPAYSGANPGAFGPETPAHSATPSAHASTHSTTQQQQHAADAAVAGAVVCVDEGEKRKALAEMSRLGIRGEMPARLLAEVPGLTVEDITTLRKSLNGKYHAGLLVSTIRGQGRDAIKSRIARQRPLSAPSKFGNIIDLGDLSGQPQGALDLARRERDATERAGREAVRRANEQKRAADIAAFRAAFDEPAWNDVVDHLLTKYPILERFKGNADLIAASAFDNAMQQRVRVLCGKDPDGNGNKKRAGQFIASTRPAPEL